MHALAVPPALSGIAFGYSHTLLTSGVTPAVSDVSDAAAAGALAAITRALAVADVPSPTHMAIAMPAADMTDDRKSMCLLESSRLPGTG
jgi:hypothetical protein